MLTILCIDDDPATLTLRGAALRAEGFQVLTASTGGEGIGLANAYKCDVVVLDYSLPDMKGEAVAGILKYAFSNLPIVLCSGYDDLPESVFKLVDAFVAKGDIPDFLLMTIQSVIGRKKLPRREQSFQRRERKRMISTGPFLETWTRSKGHICLGLYFACRIGLNALWQDCFGQLQPARNRHFSFLV